MCPRSILKRTQPYCLWGPGGQDVPVVREGLGATVVRVREGLGVPAVRGQVREVPGDPGRADFLADPEADFSEGRAARRHRHRLVGEDREDAWAV